MAEDNQLPLTPDAQPRRGWSVWRWIVAGLGGAGIFWGGSWGLDRINEFQMLRDDLEKAKTEAKSPKPEGATNYGAGNWTFSFKKQDDVSRRVLGSQPTSDGNNMYFVSMPVTPDRNVVISYVPGATRKQDELDFLIRTKGPDGKIETRRQNFGDSRLVVQGLGEVLTLDDLTFDADGNPHLSREPKDNVRDSSFSIRSRIEAANYCFDAVEKYKSTVRR